jgi:hypothetical protein
VVRPRREPGAARRDGGEGGAVLPGRCAGHRLRAGDRPGEQAVRGVPDLRAGTARLRAQRRAPRPHLRPGLAGPPDEPGLHRHGQRLACGPGGDAEKALLDAATALAWTALDVAGAPR